MGRKGRKTATRRRRRQPRRRSKLVLLLHFSSAAMSSAGAHHQQHWFSSKPPPTRATRPPDIDPPPSHRTYIHAHSATLSSPVERRRSCSTNRTARLSAGLFCVREPQRHVSSARLPPSVADVEPDWRGRGEGTHFTGNQLREAHISLLQLFYVSAIYI